MVHYSSELYKNEDSVCLKLQPWQLRLDEKYSNIPNKNADYTIAIVNYIN